MKTMRSSDGKRIFRVTDDKASVLYHNGDANYAPKEEWKKEVRDLDKPKAGDVGMEWQDKNGLVKEKHNKPSKAQKRQMRKTL